MEQASPTMFIIELDNGVGFVWRSEMTCLAPVGEGQKVEDLRPGDEVLFNKKPRTVNSIRIYR